MQAGDAAGMHSLISTFGQVCHFKPNPDKAALGLGAIFSQLHRRYPMNTYIIRRRNAWKNARELEATAALSLRIGNDEMADQVRWIRSYVVQEADGTLGTVCVYQATNADAIREHAKRVGMPANEITGVADTVIIRKDPVETEKAA